jgi:acyl-CoA thioesterase
MERDDSSGDPSVAAEVARFMTERDLFARHLGIELLELSNGYSRVRMQLAPYMLNGLGLPHGAAIFAVADYAFAAACNSYGNSALALSMDIHFLYSPYPGSQLVCEAQEVQKGNRTGLYRMTVTDDAQNIVAELHGMAYRKHTRFLEELHEL